MHSKRLHWVSLATLEKVAEACLAEGRAPYKTDARIGYPGAYRATHFQRGLLLKVLVRIPLRQRNLREMRLDQHLYKDAQTGHWHLHFRGDDLKIGTRGGRVNEYHVDITEYCPDLLPALTEWLTVYRPRVLRPTSPPFVFLTSRGTQFGDILVRQELAYVVARETGQRFYPHLIRSIWATEYLEKTQDFTTAAVMLGDTLGVVMRTYYDVVNRDHHAKAKAFLGEALPGLSGACVLAVLAHGRGGVFLMIVVVDNSLEGVAAGVGSRRAPQGSYASSSNVSIIAGSMLLAGEPCDSPGWWAISGPCRSTRT